MRLLGKRIAQKALGGQLRLVQVATRHTRTADVKLTGDARRQGLQVPIKHINPCIGDGYADVQRTAGKYLAGGGNHRGFGRAIVVDHGVTAVVGKLTQAVAADQ
ncbi:hypothetical protein ALO94_200392 [Pseudomonas syringae pv. spinaceae]|uniref:Uncharacterized protein n=1 Tax=Pseudomonas syringae pv. spinaceae TaxID=264459 RepID=A0A0Q0BJ94_PSESX|nr:hypothetical protein ALO94_200392 [Pseudomonas syringae pv. spinaceae]